MNLIIKQLEMFIAVAETNSFTQAAYRMNVPKASISQGISKLENRLKTRLLNRTTRSVSLTFDGQLFLARSQQLLNDLDEIEGLFLKEPQLSGQIHVNVPSRIARQLLLPNLSAFLNTYPDINITIDSQDEQIDLVQKGVDCVIRVGQTHDSSLIVKPIGQLKMINALSPDYIKQYGTPCSLADLPQHYLVDYRPPSPFSSTSSSLFSYRDKMQSKQIAMNYRVSVSNAESYIAAGIAGLGLIQIPRYDIQQDLAEQRLLEVLSAWPPASMPIAFLYPHRKYLSLRVKIFIDWATQLLKPYCI